jgi:hypothetical protein
MNRAVLTPDQQARYNQNKQAMRERMQQHMRNHQPANHPQK